MSEPWWVDSPGRECPLPTAPRLPYQGQVTLLTHQPLRNSGMGGMDGFSKKAQRGHCQAEVGQGALGDTPSIQAQASPKMKHVKENFQKPVAHQK